MVRHQTFFDQLTAFANYLRKHSYSVGVEDVSIAMMGLTHIDLGKRSEFISLLKTVFSGSREEWENLQDHYRDFIKDHERAINSKITKKPEVENNSNKKRFKPRSRQIHEIKNWLFNKKKDTLNTPFYNNVSSNDLTNLAFYELEHQEEIQAAIKLFIKALRYRRKNRKKDHRSKGEINLSRLQRSRFFYGDELIKLPYRYRPKSRTKLVLLCDVSRSMQLYAHFLSQFIYHLHHGFTDQMTYVFNTRIFQLGQHGRNSWDEIKTGLEAIPGMWSGGTRIGASLLQFLEERPPWVDRRTKVVIFSDGWDTGELDVLEEAMFQLTKCAGQIIWLNPVLKSPAAAKVAGMSIVKHYLDFLAPCYDIASLRGAADQLAGREGIYFEGNVQI